MENTMERTQYIPRWITAVINPVPRTFLKCIIVGEKSKIVGGIELISAALLNAVITPQIIGIRFKIPKKIKKSISSSFEMADLFL